MPYMARCGSLLCKAVAPPSQLGFQTSSSMMPQTRRCPHPQTGTPSPQHSTRMLVNLEITFSLFEEEELDDRLPFAIDGQFSDLTASVLRSGSVWFFTP